MAWCRALTSTKDLKIQSDSRLNISFQLYNTNCFYSSKTWSLTTDKKIHMHWFLLLCPVTLFITHKALGLSTFCLHLLQLWQAFISQQQLHASVALFESNSLLPWQPELRKNGIEVRDSEDIDLSFLWLTYMILSLTLGLMDVVLNGQYWHSTFPLGAFSISQSPVHTT